MSEVEEAEFTRGLRELNSAYGLVGDETALDTCLQHFRVLLKWNRVMNLVGDLTVQTAISRHYGESLFLASRLDPDWQRVVDFGTGAGFPGIGVGAAWPLREVDLLEIRQKRIAFLREATRDIRNMRVVAGDAAIYERHADAVISRAVDVRSILQFADKHKIPCCLLLGETDADQWHSQLIRDRKHCELYPVPWRTRSVVVTVRPTPADPKG